MLVVLDRHQIAWRVAMGSTAAAVFAVKYGWCLRWWFTGRF